MYNEYYKTDRLLKDKMNRYQQAARRERLLAAATTEKKEREINLKRRNATNLAYALLLGR